jgi:hypothetical protein
MAARTSPIDMRAHDSASSARNSSVGTETVVRAMPSWSISATASSNRFDSTAASARATTLSTRSRSLDETPVSRNEGSTPSRLASHSTVSPVGRVFPRSIWLTYSFENRSPASSVCVSPRAMRSWRTRSPIEFRAGPWAVRAAVI